MEDVGEPQLICTESELDDKQSGFGDRRSTSIPHSVTSESGFHSPTPPPRSHKKRFRSAESSRNCNREYESVGRRSRSCSDAEETPVLKRKEMRDASTNTLPQRPPKPKIKPKPVRPPQPTPTTLIRLALERTPSTLSSNSESTPNLNELTPNLKRTKLTPNGSIPNLSGGSASAKPIRRRPLPPPPAPPRSRTPRPTPTPSPIPPPLNSENDFIEEESIISSTVIAKPQTAPTVLSQAESIIPSPIVVEKAPSPQPPTSEIGTNTTSELMGKLTQIDASRINVMEIQVQRLNVGAIEASVLSVSGLSIGDSFPIPFPVSPTVKKKPTDSSPETKLSSDCESNVSQCPVADSLCSTAENKSANVSTETKLVSECESCTSECPVSNDSLCSKIENESKTVCSETTLTNACKDSISECPPASICNNAEIISADICQENKLSNEGCISECHLFTATLHKSPESKVENICQENKSSNVCEIIIPECPIITESLCEIEETIPADICPVVIVASECETSISEVPVIADLVCIEQEDISVISQDVVQEIQNDIVSPYIDQENNNDLLNENIIDLMNENNNDLIQDSNIGNLETIEIREPVIEVLQPNENAELPGIDQENNNEVFQDSSIGTTTESVSVIDIPVVSDQVVCDSTNSSSLITAATVEDTEVKEDAGEKEEKKEKEKEAEKDDVDKKNEEDKKKKKDGDDEGGGNQGGGNNNNKEGDGGGGDNDKGDDGGDRRDEGFGDDFDQDSEPPDWWKNAAPPPDNDNQQSPGGGMTGSITAANPVFDEERSRSPSPKKYKMIDKLVISPIPVPGGLGSSIFYTGGAMRTAYRKSSPSLSEKSSSSTSSGGHPLSGRRSASEKKPRRSSWYDADDPSGQSGDVDTSDGHVGAENSRRVSLPDDKSGATVPSAPSPTDSDVEGVSQVRKKILDLFGLRDRKKNSRLITPGYHEGSPTSSSSTTDGEIADNPSWVRVLPLPSHPNISSSSSSASHSEPEPFTETHRDANANYYKITDELSCPAGYQILSKVGARPLTLEKTTKVPNGDLQHSGVTIVCNGSSVNSEDANKTQGGCVSDCSPKVTLRTKSEGVSSLDPSKRLTNSSTISATSEDSWYNCTSGDESDTESCFMTSHSCIEDQIDGSKETKLFKIAEEIMTSERVFVDVLKLINEDFRNFVIKANERQEQKVIPDDHLNFILRFLPQLQNLNEDLLQDLKTRIKNWEEFEKIADVIVKKGPFLKLYSSYIKEYESIVASFDEACRKYPVFEQVVKEFEASDKCKSLALRHYMLKPVQRIPQYRLLLETYLKNLDGESPDYQDTIAALAIVSDVANHANQSMKEGDNFTKLLQIQNNLSDEYEIIRPGRVFLKEGELLKSSRKGMQSRWFILFNDSLLHTDKSQQGYYNLHHELPLVGMKVMLPTNEEFQNEFSIISIKRSFTLSARSPEERDKWINALNTAIQELNAKRTTFDKSKVVPLEVTVPFVLGKEAPVWIPDSRVTMCQLCTKEFTVTFRRHHCRACGKVVCASCSANRAPLKYLKYQSARVCDECFFKLATEFEASESDGSTERVSDPRDKTSEESGSSVDRIREKFKRMPGSNGKKIRRPKVLKEVTANDQNATISGYLKKREKKSWKRFWFVIHDKVLYTYKASEDVAALESIPLLGFEVQSYSESGLDSTQVFQLVHLSHSSMVFQADNSSSAERWIKAMKAATVLE